MLKKRIISYGTLKNTKQQDKPNEDLVFGDLDRNIFILLDGVSRDTINGKYPSGLVYHLPKFESNYSTATPYKNHIVTNNLNNCPH